MSKPEATGPRLPDLKSKEPVTARERVLSTALNLFIHEGVRAVGVDTIIARSGVAKMSLYRSFPSKDDLVAAALAEWNRLYWAWWEGVVAPHPDDPAAQLRAIFAALAKRTTAATYPGCPFLNTTVEFREMGHKGRAVALANKAELRRRLTALAEEVGTREPPLLAHQLFLLMEGAYVSARNAEPDITRDAIMTAAASLVEAATRR